MVSRYKNSVISKATSFLTSFLPPAAIAVVWTGMLVCMPLGSTSAVGQESVPPQNSETDEIRVESTRFAPGTVRVIPPAPLPEETYTGPMQLSDLLKSNPEIDWTAPDFPDGAPFFDTRSRTLIEQASQVILRREIFCLEFSFKPLRQVYVDVPTPNGVMERKLVWYLVYRVRYTGGDLRPAKTPDATVAVDELYSRIEKVSYRNRRLFPLAYLKDAQSGRISQNQIIPIATPVIRAREKITAPLLNAVEITETAIEYSSDPAADGVWGVFTWADVDPSTDFISIFVEGLTNAFQQTDEAGEKKMLKKSLQLNFYRPGDTVRQTEDRIRFGVPAFTDPDEQAYVLKQYGLEKRLDYQWVYR